MPVHSLSQLACLEAFPPSGSPASALTAERFVAEKYFKSYLTLPDLAKQLITLQTAKLHTHEPQTHKAPSWISRARYFALHARANKQIAHGTDGTDLHRGIYQCVQLNDLLVRHVACQQMHPYSVACQLDKLCQQTRCVLHC